MKKLMAMMLVVGAFAQLHDVRADANYWQDGVPWEIGVSSYSGYACINVICDKSVSGDIVVPGGQFYGYDIVVIARWALWGCENITGVTVPASITNIQNLVFRDCTSLKRATILGNLKKLSECTFEECWSLEDVNLPDSIELIEYAAFRNCYSLKSIVIPASTKVLENDVFAACTNLTKVVLPEGLLDIGATFCACSSLTDIEIPSSVTNVDGNAFYNCPSLKTIAIPEGVRNLDWYVFGDCISLTDVKLPSTLTNIGDTVFSGCTSLKSLVIPNGVQSIGKSAFSGCTSLDEIELPATVKSIGRRAFRACSSLRSLTIPAGVDNIGMSTFEGCESLTTLTIPATVTGLVASAFNYCPNLTSIAFNGDAPVVSEDDWGEESFKGISDSCTIYVRYGTKGWGEVPGKWNGFDLAWQPGYEPPPGPIAPPAPPSGGSIIAAGPRPVFVGVIDDGVASVWDGWTVAGGDAIGGVLQVKVGKSNGKKPSKVTATLVPAVGKKLSFKGEMDGVDANTAVLKCRGQADMELEFGEKSLNGAFDGEKIVGARNLFMSKDKQEAKDAEATLAPYLGAVNIAFDGGNLSLSIAKKGKVRVTGLVDGVKVSATAQLIIGDEGLAIPVLVTKKADLSFLVWLAADGVAVEGLDGVVAAGAPAPKDALAFKLDDGFDSIAGVQAGLLPTAFAFGGGLKWSFRKADTVKLNADKTAAEVTKDNGNPSGLKLTYKPKDGSFKGKLTVYAVEGGKLKKYSANVTGVMIGAKGYGTATVKKPAASAAVTIE